MQGTSTTLADAEASHVLVEDTRTGWKWLWGWERKQIGGAAVQVRFSLGFRLSVLLADSQKFSLKTEDTGLDIGNFFEDVDCAAGQNSWKELPGIYIFY